MMMKSVAIAAGAAVLALGAYTPARANEGLAASKGCVACHQVKPTGAPALGPVYTDVAAKYKGDAAAEAMLVERVIKGGDGHWQTLMPAMPPNAVTEDEAKKLVQWIMSL